MFGVTGESVAFANNRWCFLPEELDSEDNDEQPEEERERPRQVLLEDL